MKEDQGEISYKYSSPPLNFGSFMLAVRINETYDYVFIRLQIFEGKQVYEKGFTKRDIKRQYPHYINLVDIYAVIANLKDLSINSKNSANIGEIINGRLMNWEAIVLQGGIIKIIKEKKLSLELQLQNISEKKNQDLMEEKYEQLKKKIEQSFNKKLSDQERHLREHFQDQKIRYQIQKNRQIEEIKRQLMNEKQKEKQIEKINISNQKKEIDYLKKTIQRLIDEKKKDNSLINQLKRERENDRREIMLLRKSQDKLLRENQMMRADNAKLQKSQEMLLKDNAQLKESVSTMRNQLDRVIQLLSQKQEPSPINNLINRFTRMNMNIFE